MIAIFIDINVLSTLFQICFTTVFSDDTFPGQTVQPLSVPIAVGLTAYAVLNLLFYCSTFLFKYAHNCNFNVSPIGLKFTIFTAFIKLLRLVRTPSRTPCRGFALALLCESSISRPNELVPHLSQAF